MMISINMAKKNLSDNKIKSNMSNDTKGQITRKIIQLEELFKNQKY